MSNDDSILFSDEDVSFSTDSSISFANEDSTDENLLNGKYKLGEVVGRGAFGEVYLCTDVSQPNDSEQLVIKMIRVSGGDAATKALQEVVPLRKIRHENLLLIKNFFIHTQESTITNSNEWMFCIVMPYYCEGDFAKELARRKKEEIYYTEEELRNMMKQIVSAVDHLHSKSLMHRDLKPANLFMADNGQRLVLGDFGLVKELEEDFANTVAGTMKYLAPEILSMKKYNLSADVWSLGCIMLELTQLELSKVMYIDALVKNDITAIVDSMVLPRYSRNIARTIGKMLQANPDDRPTTSVILKMLTDYEIEETESFGRPMQGIVEYDLDLQKTRLVSGEDWSMVKHIFAIDNSVHVVASSVYRVQNNGSYDKISLQCGWHHSIGCQIDGKIYFIDQDPKLQTHPLHVYNPNDGSYITLNKENWGVCKGMAGHGGYLYLFCAAIYKLNITNGKYVKASTVTGWSGCYNAVTVGDRIFVTSPSSGKIFGWAVDTDEYSTISGLPMHEYTPYIHKDNKLYMFGKQKVTLVNLDTNEIQEREDIPCNVIAATYIPHLNKVWFISY